MTRTYSYETDYYSYSTSDVHHTPHPKLGFQGYPTFHPLEDLQQKSKQRVWCRGNNMDHGPCKKPTLKAAVVAAVVHKSKSSSRSSIKPVKSKSGSGSSHSIPAPAVAAAVAVAVAVAHSSKSSHSGKSRKLSRKSSRSSSKHHTPAHVAAAPTHVHRGGAFGHIPHKGYDPDNLDLHYHGKSGIGAAVAAGALGAAGAHHQLRRGYSANTSRMLGGNAPGHYVNNVAAAPCHKNAYRRELAHVGACPPDTFWAKKNTNLFVPPVPTTEDPYAHRRANTQYHKRIRKQHEAHNKDNEAAAKMAHLHDPALNKQSSGPLGAHINPVEHPVAAAVAAVI